MVSRPHQHGAIYIEIACFNVISVLAADEAGADRIEFCADRESGGVTPPLFSLETIRGRCNKPINVMIRPRGGNFNYSDIEFERMKCDIHNIMSLGGIAHGFVFGILDASKQVDRLRNKELVDIANPLPCTFHRAFDEVIEMEKALDDVIDCGFKTILTSGGAANAVTGAQIIGKLIERSKGKLSIMPGGGVRSSNLQIIADKTQAEWYHSSAISNSGEDTDVDEIRLLKKHCSLNERS